MKPIAPQPHIVAFLDVLGFKALLLRKNLSLLNVMFEEFADTLYRQHRLSNLFGLQPLLPTLMNFSDSIILFSPLQRDDQLDVLGFQQLLDACRALLVVGLRIGIALRGVIAIGDLYVGDALSVVPQSVSRGPGVGLTTVLEKFGRKKVFPKGYESAIIPPIKMSIHMGAALTSAYLLEESINSIGIFMSPSDERHEFVSFSLAAGRLHRVTIDKQDLLSADWIDWCESMFGYDEIERIVDIAQGEIADTTDERIKQKWESFLATR
jgi:hypothetical protein